MTSCPHLTDLGPRLLPPRISQHVHREECTLCFDNQDGPDGIDVCLSCFNGGCAAADRQHGQTHFEHTGHPLVVNVKRKQKPRVKKDELEPPLKRLMIEEDRDEDKYEFETRLKCHACGEIELPAPEGKVMEVVDAVMTSMSSARQSEVKAWEEEIEACEHSVCVAENQVPPRKVESPGAHCSQCELNENLWLCLTCGNLGCGREQWGAGKDGGMGGGHSHGLAHYDATGHPLAVKLGTITSEGNADIYCYACNDARIDPNLAKDLANFGINIASQVKTEKSMTELQLEQNMKFDFSMTGDDGKTLEPVFGPGLTGLANLGNSCYMASVLQAVFSLPSFKDRYLTSFYTHSILTPEPDPSQNLEMQMAKIADGLLSGRYSKPREADPDAPPEDLIPESADESDRAKPVFQEGIKPNMFKSLVGKGHAEFSTMRQQDSEEFLAYLVKTLRQDHKRRGLGIEEDATQTFAFGMEQRLQCTECKGVRYRVDNQDSISVPVPAEEKQRITDEGGQEKIVYKDVDLRTCVDLLTNEESIEYSCPACKKNVHALKRTRFTTFPETLVVHSRRFQLVNWVPTKLDVAVTNTSELELDPYVGKGKQDDETELPEEADARPAEPTFNASAMAMLTGMGFPEIRCKRALLATGNSSGEAAMEWLFAHMEDPDIDAPLPTPSAGRATANEPSAEQVAMLGDMGFTPAQARKALRETGGDPERAVEWLFNHPDDTGEDEAPAADAGAAPAEPVLPGSKELPAKYRLKAFISHKGPSVHSGHYVAHIRTNDGWVLFNDEKVVKAEGESVEKLKGLAYLYLYERV